ncbi:ribosomal protein L31 [Thiovulum sp. ES]|nr:ribosomal protein L31 [Thiovulum sp. ES]
MKKGIHPDYIETTVNCACGNEFKTKSLSAEIRVDICGACHPFYTGSEKVVDTTGRIDKFNKRYNFNK